MSFKVSDRPEFQIDSRNQTGFTAFIRGLPETEKLVRVFERENGNYYSVHGNDALHVANTVYKTMTVINYLGGNGKMDKGVPSCTLSKLNAEIFLRKVLLEDNFKVEIWGQDGKRPGWSVVRQASPGNLTEVEDLLFANTDSNISSVVMALWLQLAGGVKTIGAAFVDNSARVIGVSEFIETDTYSNIESFIIQHQAKECLVLSDEEGRNLDLIKMKSCIERSGMMVSSCKKAMFNSKNVEQDLNRLLSAEISVSALPEFELSKAMLSVGCLIQYLSLASDESNLGQYQLKQYNLNQYMRLDNSAIKALNLVPTASDGNNKTMSLQGLLDRCKTNQGSRLLAQWIKQPLVNIQEIEERQDLVGIFYEDLELREQLRNIYLKAIPDLTRLSRKFTRGSANLQDVIRVYQAIIKLPGLYDTLRSVDEKKNILEKHYINDLKKYIDNTTSYQEMVETTIDLDLLDSHQYIIKPDFDHNLQELKREMDQTLQKMHSEQEQTSMDLGMEMDKKLKLEQSPTYGYCFRLSRNDASCLRNKQSKYHELSTLRNGVYFTTSVLRKYSERYMDLSTSYDRTQSSLVKEIIKIGATYSSVMNAINTTIAHLDVVVSMAEAASTAPVPYVRPKMVVEKPNQVNGIQQREEGSAGGVRRIIRLKNCRHPCLEVQENVNFIPNDVDMVTYNQSGENKQRDKEFIVITGPNMGGKSTYIKQVGIIVLMAQMGSYIPCDQGEEFTDSLEGSGPLLSIFDGIYARVGAGDAIYKGVSTFMAEMLETAQILNNATSNSLIIIDELGRGTSTFDGYGLAFGISQYIMERLGAFCLFATHFHELTTKLVEANSCGANKVCNLHVMAKITGSSISTGTSAGASGNASGNKDVSSSDVEEFLTLLYKIVEGPSDQSFGIQVAKMAGFPESVLDLATKRLVQTTASISNGNDGDDVEMADVDQGADDKEQGVQLIIEFLSSITKDIKSSTMNSNGGGNSGGGAGDKQRVLQIINKHKDAYMPKFSQNRYISQLLCL